MLPLHPRPVPGEVLSSYLTRLALENGLKPRSLAARLGMNVVYEVDPDVLAPLEAVRALEAMTGHPLLETSLMPMLLRLSGETRLPRFVPLLLRGEHTGLPVCPQCLRETGAVQRHWRLATSVVCERHGLRLLDTCPGCQAPVRHRWPYPKGAPPPWRVLHRPWLCWRCGEALEDQRPQDDAALGAVLHVQRMMYEATEEGWVRWRGLVLAPGEFRVVLSALNRTVMGVASGYRGRIPGWCLEKALVEERYRVLAVVGGLMDGNLDQCLSRLREQGVTPARLWRDSIPVPDWLRDEAQQVLGEGPGGFTRAM